MLGILECIKQYQTIIIHRHTRPDGDCMGSQVGLKEIIKATFPDKQVLMTGEEQSQFHYLGRMDNISDELYKNALVVILDVANSERISDKRYPLGKHVIRIDHHPKVETIGHLEWIDTSYAACCEMIVDWYRENEQELKMTQLAATALFYGVVTDTNRFLSLAINSRTFMLAAYLLEYSINTSEIYDSIYDESENITRLKGYVGSHFIKTEHGLGYITIDQALCEKYQVDANACNVLVNTLNNTNGVRIYFVAIYDKDSGRVRISLRSKELSINQFASKYGGGGHKQASGIMVDSFSDILHLVNDLEEYLSQN